MCGIVGLLNLNLEPVKKSVLFKMNNMLKHRGPDGSGYWIANNLGLAHSRLSIIDLSEKASQPMQSSCGRFVITYNGELYNFMELREELKKSGVIFKSQSDTEVVLYSYVKWKEKMLIKI